MAVDDQHSGQTSVLDLDQLLQRADALRSRDADRAALALYREATQLAPSSFEAWLGLAHTCWKLARSEESLAASERALAFDPRSMLAWEFKVEALLCLRRYEEALAICDLAFAVHPGDAQIRHCQSFAQEMLRSNMRR